ncbi:MAG: gfo/Idh/MocA family oxidoreductase [Calditrichaeota bacterium]|nr:MAG: gfo/Idh/MocA family oxidoreductase [Calditrichota bacterium]
MNIAVIGCGYWGPNLIRNFNAINECNIDLCCDLDPKKLERMTCLFRGIKVTTDFKEIINAKSIDAVAIATPVHTHYNLAKACLLANKHVLVEKPLASSSDECMELIRISKEMNKILMVGHTFEYSPAVNKAKEILQSGEIGDILYISSLRLNLGLFQTDINVVWDLAPHDISIILYLLNKVPTIVNAQGKAHYFENIEDVATETLHFNNGEVAFLHQSWLDPYKVRKMTIVGTKKMLVYDDVQSNEKIKIFDKGIDAPPHYDTFAEFHFAYRYGDIFSPRIEEREPLRIECEHFLECIRAKKTPRTDGYSGLRVVSILEAMNYSMNNNGSAVQINGLKKAVKDKNNHKQKDLLTLK